MKHKMSITMDEELILKVLDTLRSRRFRNKSHVIEYAVSRYFDNECDECESGAKNEKA